MNTARSTLLLAAAVATLPAGALAQSQKPPKPPKPAPGSAPALTLGSAPNPVVFGSATTLSGRLTGADSGSRTIRVEADPYPYGNGFAAHGTVVTAKNGAYQLPARPQRNTRYRALTVGGTGVQTGEHLLSVRRRVGLTASDLTPRRGQLIRFSGSVAPAGAGRSVAIQRLSPTGRFATVARTTTVAAGSGLSRYSRRVRVFRTGTYRVKVVGDAVLVNGVSRSVGLVVR